MNIPNPNDLSSHTPRRRRAQASGMALSEVNAAIVKGMLIRGDRSHDIAAYFGVNSGRIAEISTGARFMHVSPALLSELPEPGPYVSSINIKVLQAKLGEVRRAIEDIEAALSE